MGPEKPPNQPKVEKTAEEAEEERKRERLVCEKADEVEKEITHIPNGLKEILAGGYGLAAALFRKDKQVGFLKTFLEKKDIGLKSITKIDDAVVEGNYDQVCTFFEKVIAISKEPDKKRKYEEYYESFKADHERKKVQIKRDSERNDEIGNAFQKLWERLGS